MRNHIGKFRVYRDFVKGFKAYDTYSTPDGQYDSRLPVYCSDFVKIAHPIDLNAFIKIEDGVVQPAYFRYAFSEKRNQYIKNVTHPLIEGIIVYLKRYAQALRKAAQASGSETVTFN